MAKIEFSKMHGLGNDFVLLDCRRKEIKNLDKYARRICSRRFGVGCDQIIVILPSRVADYRMKIYNADGSEVEMCGNGIRCFAKYLWDRKDKIIRAENQITVETLAGVIEPKMIGDDMIQVDMGEPIFDGKEIPSIFAHEMVNAPMKFFRDTYRVTLVSMGNPHAVIFTDDVSKVNLSKLGPLIENDVKKFPNRINVEFVEVINRRRVKARVWERGVGETLACGTGACAVAVASSINGKTDRLVRVELPGGTLAIKWTMRDRVLMTGSAKEVYTGVMTL